MLAAVKKEVQGQDGRCCSLIHLLIVLVSEYEREITPMRMIVVNECSFSFIRY